MSRKKSKEGPNLPVPATYCREQNRGEDWSLSSCHRTGSPETSLQNPNFEVSSFSYFLFEILYPTVDSSGILNCRCFDFAG